MKFFGVATIIVSLLILPGLSFAEQFSANCQALLTSKTETVSIQIPQPDKFTLSPITERIVKNIKKLGVPFEYNVLKKMNGERPSDFDEVSVELTFTQFIEAYKTLPGGVELINILQDPTLESEVEIKNKIKAWMAHYIPGYRIEWLPPTDEHSFVYEDDYFNLLNEKAIPVANQHDILAHLFLFADPTLRELTERVARVYVQADNYHKKMGTEVFGVNLKAIANSFWTRIQEYTPVGYTDDLGRDRIAIIGGLPAIHDPIQAYLGTILDWIYTGELSGYYSNLNRQLLVQKNVEDRDLLIEMHEGLLTLIGRQIGLPESASHRDISSRLKNSVEVIDEHFQDISLQSQNYGERWVLFSDLLYRSPSRSEIHLLRPEFHRELMTKSVSLLEELLKDYQP